MSSPPPDILRVFLCHSSGDKPAVRDLYRRLLRENCDPWLDEEKLVPGQNWPREISRAVKDAHIVVVCLSRTSVSKKGFVQKEIKVALDAADELPEGTIFIIPLRLEECDVPDRLGELHWVDLFEEKGFDRLIKALDLRASSLGLRKQEAPVTHPVEDLRSRFSSTVRDIAGVFSAEVAELAIDLGDVNTRIYIEGRGVVLDEPSLVFIDEEKNIIKYVGNEAKKLIGRPPPRCMAYYPVKEGFILNSQIAGEMLRQFIERVYRRKLWTGLRVVIAVSSQMEQIYRQAYMDAAYRAKATEVYLVERGLCAAIGAGILISEPTGNLIVDIGAGITEIALVSLNGIVYSRTMRVGGKQMDEAIAQYIKRKYDLLIGERTAEALKIELGSAFPLDEELAYDVRGRNLTSGIPQTITVSDEEVREAIADAVSTIINSVRIALERIPPELSADVVERGIVITGGGALLKNFARRLSVETGLPVSIADEPLMAVVLGAGKLLSNPELLKVVKS